MRVICSGTMFYGFITTSLSDISIYSRWVTIFVICWHSMDTCVFFGSSKTPLGLQLGIGRSGPMLFIWYVDKTSCKSAQKF